jgi:hypothetical protein
VLEPKTKAVEAPRSRPPEQRPEEEPIGDRAREPESSLVVVAGDEGRPALVRDEAPTAVPGANQRTPVGTPEPKRCGATPVAGVFRSHEDAFPADPQPKADPSREKEPLRLLLGPREILELREP